MHYPRHCRDPKSALCPKGALWTQSATKQKAKRSLFTTPLPRTARRRSANALRTRGRSNARSRKNGGMLSLAATGSTLAPRAAESGALGLGQLGDAP